MTSDLVYLENVPNPYVKSLSVLAENTNYLPKEKFLILPRKKGFLTLK